MTSTVSKKNYDWAQIVVKSKYSGTCYEQQNQTRFKPLQNVARFLDTLNIIDYKMLQTVIPRRMAEVLTH